MAQIIYLDCETRSAASLSKCGVYRYCEHPDFAVLTIAYSVNGGDVKVLDLPSGMEVPADLIQMLLNPSVIKIAHNAEFDRVCLTQMLKRRGIVSAYLDPCSWRCSMVMCAYVGLPQSLHDAAIMLDLKHLKLESGKKLIRKFCEPQDDGTFIQPASNPEDWTLFLEYNKADVETLIDLHKEIASRAYIPDTIWEEYAMNEEINDRGVGIDYVFANAAKHMADMDHEQNEKAFQLITGIDPDKSNKRKKFLTWLSDHGVTTSSLNKDSIEKLTQSTSGDVAEALKTWQRISKTSLCKFGTMLDYYCTDHRIHGQLRFMGAARTGRFSARGVQTQNIPKTTISNIDSARKLVERGDIIAVNCLYDSTSQVLESLLRTCLIPGDGYPLFCVADYAQIEARILACLAGERWRIDVFRTGTQDIYSASASAMFGVPVSKHGPNSELRQKGKVAELALGYGGSVGALKAMGALDKGLKEEELPGLVRSWRCANPHIVEYWKQIDRAVQDAVIHQHPSIVHGLKIECCRHQLMITLLSGRIMYYQSPHVVLNEYGKSIAYEGIDSTHTWREIESYGPKWVENIIQGIARDVLCHALLNLRKFRVCCHVHDEVIVEISCPDDSDEISRIMEVPPPWMPDLPLKADAFITPYYTKG